MIIQIQAMIFHHKYGYLAPLIFVTYNASAGTMKKTTKLQCVFAVFIFMHLYAMDKKDTTNNPSGKSIVHRKRGKGLLHKSESVKELAVRT